MEIFFGKFLLISSSFRLNELLIISTKNSQKFSGKMLDVIDKFTNFNISGLIFVYVILTVCESKYKRY